VNHRQARALGDLRDAADIAGGDHVGLRTFDIRRLAVAQLRRDFRLEQVVGSRRAAAEMALRRIEHDKTRRRQQVFRLVADFLAVLERTGAVIGDALASGLRRLLQADFAHQFGHVARQRRNFRGLFRQFRVVAEHEAVILDCRAAA
jgi:hypothetical protein